ncbi:MAG TPA: DUF4396 domain-containing protein [Steroidobacteraceae bacterium]|jgi:hypothetical protein
MNYVTFPLWLHNAALTSLLLAVVAAIVIAVDEIRHPQEMWIMNLVWPITTLFGSVFWLLGYYRWGRPPTQPDHHPDLPFAAAVAKGTSHCGAGCTLGDLVAEWTVFSFPVIAVWFGWQSLFEERTFAVWIPDLILAFIFGIGFQYFSIKPMRDLSMKDGLVAAVKADVASIGAWQVGMYGAMAALQFGWYHRTYGTLAPINSPEFWFAMQLAMLAGFVTSYPVNWWLLRKGIKEAM